MTEEEARKRLEESPLNKIKEPVPKAGPSNEHNLIHHDAEIQKRARKHYRECPETKRLVDEIFEGQKVLTEPFNGF